MDIDQNVCVVYFVSWVTLCPVLGLQVDWHAPEGAHSYAIHTEDNNGGVCARDDDDDASPGAAAEDFGPRAAEYIARVATRLDDVTER